jgi:hypothetical protein
MRGVLIVEAAGIPLSSLVAPSHLIVPGGSAPSIVFMFFQAAISTTRKSNLLRASIDDIQLMSRSSSAMTTKRSVDAMALMPPKKMPRLSNSSAKDEIPVKVVECISKWDLTICAQPATKLKHQHSSIGSPLPSQLFKFRVNSAFLSVLSPVFDRMLNGPFKESQAPEIT